MKQIFKGGLAWSAGREPFEGVLVEDGRIIAIGPDALTAESDEVIDLAGGFCKKLKNMPMPIQVSLGLLAVRMKQR